MYKKNNTKIAPLLYDDELLFYLRDNFLVVEFWHKTHSTDKSFGLTKIPLHTFYLAYRNPFILKHLIKNKLPIVGTDWWEPIYSLDNEDIVGQLKVLVALGTDEQINNLKTERGFNLKFVTANSSRQKQVRSCVVEKQKPRVLTSEKNIQVHSVAKQDATTQVDAKKYLRFSPEPKMEDKEPKASNITQELLGSFLNQLMAQKKQAPPAKSGVNIETNANEGVIEENLQNVQSVTNVQLKRTSDLLDSLQKAISVDKVQNKQHASSLKGYFQAAVSINSANHLPSRKRCKSKRSRSFSNKTEENILPSCYVSFENIPEDPLKVTPVIFRTTTPVWNFKCNVKLPLELLHNPQKKLIFKVWRKSNSAVSTPNMQADTVLGFAAMDLTVLLSGFPNIQGWFNIIDFSGKCNGQINIHVTPLEDLSPYKIQRDCPLYSTEIAGQQNAEPKDQPPSDPKEPSELLSRALKRKFSELDEITQRLRLRLSKVTDEDSDASSDGVTEQFEKDINTLSIEEDFDLINFENDTGNLKDRKVENVQSSLLMTDEQIEENEDDTSRESSKLKSGSSLTVETSNNSHTSLDQNLLAGKQQISSLLEKLTLLSAESNSLCQDRYVSGCSTSKDNASGNAFIDTEAILQELDHSSRPNIQSALAFTVEEMLDIYDSLEDSKSGDAVTSSNTDTSLITNFSDYRLAPEGQGNTSEDNDLQYNKTK